MYGMSGITRTELLDVYIQHATTAKREVESSTNPNRCKLPETAVNYTTYGTYGKNIKKYSVSNEYPPYMEDFSYRGYGTPFCYGKKFRYLHYA